MAGTGAGGLMGERNSLGLHLEKSRPGLSPGVSPGPGQEVVQHALSERACFF